MDVLLLNADEGSGLGCDATIRYGDRLVTIGCGSRDHDVELKFAGRDQAGELHGCLGPADFDVG